MLLLFIAAFVSVTDLTTRFNYLSHMCVEASRVTGISIVSSTACLGWQQGKHRKHRTPNYCALVTDGFPLQRAIIGMPLNGIIYIYIYIYIYVCVYSTFVIALYHFDDIHDRHPIVHSSCVRAYFNDSDKVRATDYTEKNHRLEALLFKNYSLGPRSVALLVIYNTNICLNYVILASVSMHII